VIEAGKESDHICAAWDLLPTFGETNDVASKHSEIAAHMAEIMQEAHSPSKIFPFRREQ